MFIGVKELYQFNSSVFSFHALVHSILLSDAIISE